MLKPISSHFGAVLAQAEAYAPGDRVRLTDEHKRQLKAAKLYSEHDEGVGVIKYMPTAKIAQIDFPGAYPGRLLHTVNIERE